MALYVSVTDECRRSKAGLLARMHRNAFREAVMAKGGSNPVVEDIRLLGSDEVAQSGLVRHAGARWFRLDGRAE